jgi:hypothetical protein
MTQDEERRLMGAAYQDHDLVFALPTGAPIEPSWYGDAVRDLVQRTDLPQICLHDRRDTHASLLPKLGVPLEVVSERLGLSNISINCRPLSARISKPRRCSRFGPERPLRLATPRILLDVCWIGQPSSRNMKRSPWFYKALLGSANGNRTRLSALKGRCPNR